MATNVPKATTTIPDSAGPPPRSSNVPSPRDVVPDDEAIREEEFPLPSAKKPITKRWATTSSVQAKIIASLRASSSKSGNLVSPTPTDDPFNTTTTTSLAQRSPSRPSTPTTPTSSLGGDISVAGGGSDKEVAKITRLESGFYHITTKGGKEKKVNDAQLDYYQWAGNACSWRIRRTTR
jgi:hypothetical protein